MGQQTKIKYTIGLMTEAGVRFALAELQAHQWPPHHVKVIATHSSLARALQSWRYSGGAPDVCNWIMCRAAEGACPWQFDLIEPPAKISLRKVNPLPGFSQWVPDRQARQLDDHLRAGGDLLVIRSSSPSDERAACTTLLRHARGVQTHEVSFKHLR